LAGTFFRLSLCGCFARQALALGFSRCFLGEALAFRFFTRETLTLHLSLCRSLAREALTLGFSRGLLG
jgi:hypothetical protein